MSLTPDLSRPTIPMASDRLYNEDLAPATERNWRMYSLFAMWMSDIHSIGGYTFAAGLFALGLVGWQVLIALVMRGRLVALQLVIAAVFVAALALAGHAGAVPGFAGVRKCLHKLAQRFWRDVLAVGGAPMKQVAAHHVERMAEAVDGSKLGPEIECD